MQKILPRGKNEMILPDDSKPAVGFIAKVDKNI